MATVLLIRHGRTSANRSGILAGRMPGVHLDSVGRRQARSLGRRLRSIPIDVVVHSPLERCVETVAGIVESRSEPVPQHPEDRLLECDYGSWSGASLGELAKQPLWKAVQDAPSTVVFPGGEAMARMAERAVDAVRDWVTRSPDGVIAVVSHGDVIKAIVSDALGQPFDEFQRIVVSPGSLSVVAYGGGRPAVLRVNEAGSRLRIAPAAARPTVGGGAV